jgi:hypothetical protein
MDRITYCISFNSFSTLPYNSSFFAPYLYKISSDASSMAPWTRLISSSVSMASNWGFLARVFFLVEGFCREPFPFCGVFVSVRGYFSGVASPSPFFSPSSPPPFPFTSSPPLSETDPFPLESMSSSSVSILWTSSFLFFFFALDCPVCST